MQRLNVAQDINSLPGWARQRIQSLEQQLSAMEIGRFERANLERHNAVLSSTLEALEDPVFCFDTTKTVLLINHACKSFLGIKANTPAPTLVNSFFDDLSLDAVLAADELSGFQDSRWRGEAVLVHQESGRKMVVDLCVQKRHGVGNPLFCCSLRLGGPGDGLQQTELKMYQEMVKHMPIGFAVWHCTNRNTISAFKLIAINEQAHKVIGFALQRDAFLLELIDPSNTQVPEFFHAVLRSSTPIHLPEFTLGHGLFAITAFPIGHSDCIGMSFEPCSGPPSPSPLFQNLHLSSIPYAIVQCPPEDFFSSPLSSSPSSSSSSSSSPSSLSAATSWMRIEYANDGFQRLTGLDAHRLRGMPLETLLGRTDRGKLQTLKEAMRKGKHVSIDAICTARDGGRFPCSLISHPVCDPSSRLLHSLLTLSPQADCLASLELSTTNLFFDILDRLDTSVVFWQRVHHVDLPSSFSSSLSSSSSFPSSSPLNPLAMVLGKGCEGKARATQTSFRIAAANPSAHTTHLRSERYPTYPIGMLMHEGLEALYQGGLADAFCHILEEGRPQTVGIFYDVVDHPIFKRGFYLVKVLPIRREHEYATLMFEFFEDPAPELLDGIPLFPQNYHLSICGSKNTEFVRFSQHPLAKRPRSEGPYPDPLVLPSSTMASSSSSSSSSAASSASSPPSHNTDMSVHEDPSDH